MGESFERFQIGDSVVVKTPGLRVWGKVIGMVAGKEPRLRIERSDTGELMVVEASQCKRLRRPVSTRINTRGNSTKN